ncbi:MAG TPA: YraN family protein [Thermoleophilaceae bacterium]|jgi:putative endonuclease
MSPDLRRIRGSLGEQIAADHLVAAGYEILDRNWRTRRGELDLVAADAAAIVFCEVKARVAGGSSGPALALDAVGPAKRRRLRHLATAWLRERREEVGAPRREQLRFDAIGITLSPTGGVVSLDHVVDAF